MKTLLLSILLTFNLLTCTKKTNTASNKKLVDIEFYQKIPTRDGINLSANIYKPHNLSEALPVILIITPYINDENHKRGMYFAQNEYIFVTVDCRGRGNSEGQFFPFENDPQDSYDVIEWIAQQPWSNGKVGMFGGSYRGMVQWLALKENPPHLKSVIPIASVGPGIDFPKIKNIYFPYIIQWLMLTSGHTANNNLFTSKYWRDKYIWAYKNHLPFEKLDSLTCGQNRVFQKWLDHPEMDSYWKGILPSEEEYAAISIPILSITGHFDVDQPGALHYYHEHMKYGKEASVNSHHLIIGPWSHHGTRYPEKSLKGLNFSDDSVLDMNQLYLDWFDWTLKDGSKPELLKDRVMYYTMGSNEWKFASNLEDLTNNKIQYFFWRNENNPSQRLIQRELSETLSNGTVSNDTLIYDPADISDYDNYVEKITAPLKFTDTSYLHEKNLIIFESEPLTKNMVINGKISCTSYISINTPDTDFELSIYEINSKGETIFLGEDILRARYRNSLEKEELVQSGNIEPYYFEGRNFFSRRIEKGSQIRLAIGYLNSIDFEKNYNSGGIVSKEGIEQSQVSTILMYYGEEYPSHITIPVKE